MNKAKEKEYWLSIAYRRRSIKLQKLFGIFDSISCRRKKKENMAEFSGFFFLKKLKFQRNSNDFVLL